MSFSAVNTFKSNHISIHTHTHIACVVLFAIDGVRVHYLRWHFTKSYLIEMNDLIKFRMFLLFVYIAQCEINLQSIIVNHLKYSNRMQLACNMKHIKRYIVWENWFLVVTNIYTIYWLLCLFFLIPFFFNHQRSFNSIRFSCVHKHYRQDVRTKSVQNRFASADCCANSDAVFKTIHSQLWWDLFANQNAFSM